MPDKNEKFRLLADAELALIPKVRKGIRKDLSTPENREFWAVAAEADRIIKTWPQWKQDLAKSMQKEWASQQDRWRDND